MDACGTRQLRHVDAIVDDDLRPAGPTRGDQAIADAEELRGRKLLAAKLKKTRAAGEERLAQGNGVPPFARGCVGVDDGVQRMEDVRQ